MKNQLVSVALATIIGLLWSGVNVSAENSASFGIDSFYPPNQMLYSWGVPFLGTTVPAARVVFTDEVAADALVGKLSFRSEGTARCPHPQIWNVARDENETRVFNIIADFRGGCSYEGLLDPTIASANDPTQQLGAVPWSFSLGEDTVSPYVKHDHPWTYPKNGATNVPLATPLITVIMSEPINMSTVEDGTWYLFRRPPGWTEIFPDLNGTVGVPATIGITPGSGWEGKAASPAISIIPIPSEAGADPLVPGRYYLILSAFGEKEWKDMNGNAMRPDEEFGQWKDIIIFDTVGYESPQCDPTCVHGSCVTTAQGTNMCICQSGWTGPSCANDTFGPEVEIQ